MQLQRTKRNWSVLYLRDLLRLNEQIWAILSQPLIEGNNIFMMFLKEMSLKELLVFANWCTLDGQASN